MISAVVPVFNAEKTLYRAVDSLLIQQEIDEIFLVEDGSQDNSLSLCYSLAEKNPIIKVLQHPGGVNKGAPESRNLGLSFAKNKWIQFMDADDELLYGKISDQLSCISGNEAFVVGKFNTFTGDELEQTIPIKDVWSGLISTRLGCTISNLWNADWIRKVGGWNESLPNMQEYYLMFELLKMRGKVVFSKNCLTSVYPQPNSITISTKGQEMKRNNYFLFRQKVKEYLKSVGELTIRRMHYYEVCTGRMLRYHQPPFEVESNRMYFSVYSNFKKLLP